MSLLKSIITSNILKHHVSKQLTVDQPNLTSQIVPDDTESTPSESKTLDLAEVSETEPGVDQSGHISKEVLRQSGVRFDENKRYVITEVYDSEKQKYIQLKKASFIGLINLESEEFIDSKTGNLLNLATALHRNKIKIEEVSNRNDVLDTTDELDLFSSSYYADLDSTIDGGAADRTKIEFKKITSAELSQVQGEVLTSTLKNSATLDAVNVSVNQPRTPKSASNDALTYDSFTNSLNSKILNGNFSSKSSNFSDMNQEETNAFNLVKTLLYKKPSNGKYIRFERVVKNKMFDISSGKVKDLSTDEYIGINEALVKGVLRINDANVLFDDSKIYVIDTVLLNSRKITLFEALEKKVVDKSKCTYKFLNTNYSIKEAMKQGYIEGKIITSHEIKWILEDFANRVESKMNLSISSKKSLDKTLTLSEHQNDVTIDEEVTKPEKLEILYSRVETSSRQNSANEYFIYDGETESYVPISDAYQAGIVINDPIRIKDPSNNNYILLKDAVIKGLISNVKSAQRIGFKNRSSFLTHNRTSYLIDSVYEPRKRSTYSLQDAIKVGLYVNGIYRNFNKGESYSIDEAISKGFILGKKVDLDAIESSFLSSLAGREISSTNAPSKPIRGVYDEDSKIKENLKLKSRPVSKSAEKRKMFNSDDSILKSKIEPFSGKIISIQDVISGKFIRPNEAEKFGLINFLNGTFKNSLTDETLKINEAIEKGFIQVDTQPSATKAAERRKRTFSEKSKRTIKSTNTTDSDILLNTDRVEIGQQFKILSVLDPVKRKHLELDEAINTGLFDVGSAMYIDPRTKKRHTLVDAIDQGLLKIADKDFRASYKLVIEENDRNFVKNISTLSIRYVVDSFTQQIIPVNVAVSKKLVNLDNGTYVGYEKIISFKEAYDKFLVFTCDDLDEPESKRAKFRVVVVRKSTTGKNMSIKSSLAKNWLNIGRRIYIDKQTNQDIPFSQALDMDLLVLKSTLGDGGGSVENESYFTLIDRSKSKDNFQHREGTHLNGFNSSKQLSSLKTNQNRSFAFEK